MMILGGILLIVIPLAVALLFAAFGAGRFVCLFVYEFFSGLPVWLAIITFFLFPFLLILFLIGLYLANREA